jgi:hypothetical protein
VNLRQEREESRVPQGASLGGDGGGPDLVLGQVVELQEGAPGAVYEGGVLTIGKRKEREKRNMRTRE